MTALTYAYFLFGLGVLLYLFSVCVWRVTRNRPTSAAWVDATVTFVLIMAFTALGIYLSDVFWPSDERGGNMFTFFLTGSIYVISASMCIAGFISSIILVSVLAFECGRGERYPMNFIQLLNSGKNKKDSAD